MYSYLTGRVFLVGHNEEDPGLTLPKDVGTWACKLKEEVKGNHDLRIVVENDGCDCKIKIGSPISDPESILVITCDHRSMKRLGEVMIQVADAAKTHL